MAHSDWINSVETSFEQRVRARKILEARETKIRSRGVDRSSQFWPTFDQAFFVIVLATIDLGTIGFLIKQVFFRH